MPPRIDPHDRRANRLYLTEKGHATLAHLTPLGKEIATDVLASISDAEIAEFLQKLLVVKNNIRQAAGKRGAANGAQGKLRQGYPQ